MKYRIAATVAVLLLAAAVVGSSSATAQATPDPPEVETQIVGGTVATTGQFPWAAALVRSDRGRSDGFACTASVISRSWVLTAAHCVLDYADEYPDALYGAFVGPGEFDVLTGTTSLPGSSGQRLRVASIHPRSSFDAYEGDDDVAIVRLQSPTLAPAISVIGTSATELALDDTGADATAIGWGVTSWGSGVASPYLRYVQVPVQSSATCTSAYPPGSVDDLGYPIEFHGSNMLCAGPLAGGKDACQGDSGGPLAVQAADDSWRQIGVVSFGYRCAVAGRPGVYHRLTTSASWISRSTRFGPFDPNGFAFVIQQYEDFTGRPPTTNQLVTWLNRLATTPARDLTASLQASRAWDENAGMNTRLYRAAFLRDPETAGLDFWVRRRWAGRGPVSIATQFATSPEFLSRYGTLSNHDFVGQIYENVLERATDPGGLAYWTSVLDGGRPRGQVLYELSNSPEYRSATATEVRVITTRFGLLRRVPTTGEIAAGAALSEAELIDSMRLSFSYAARFPR